MAQTIGIVTSLKWTSGNQFRTRFETGYGAGLTYASGSPVEMGGAYDSVGKKNRKSYSDVDALNSNATILVSLGGLVSAHPVVQKSKRPFIVLVGRIPEQADFALTDNPGFCGGIELNMVYDNIKRRAALMSMLGTTDPTSIYLLFNPNSRLGQSEANAWIAQGGGAVPGAMPGFNDSNEFAPAFKRLQTLGAAGVVISSDPFFSRHRGDLVAAANTAYANFGIVMCYPFDIYASPTAPTHLSAISYGPDILATYGAMGRKAKAIATALDGGGSAPFEGLDTAALPANPTVY